MRGTTIVIPCVPYVIPADAGIQGHKNNRFLLACFALLWIPACAGMTGRRGNDGVGDNAFGGSPGTRPGVGSEALIGPIHSRPARTAN